MPAIIKLPYMGKHKETHARIARANTLEIPFADLHEHEAAQVEDATRPSDPYEVLVRKVTHLAELLDITEQEAERVLFQRIGQ